MITTSNINIYLKGVRAEFANVVDQAAKQLSSYQANIYLDATNKVGGLFEEVSAVGRQRVEEGSVTGVQELQPTEEAQEFVSGDYVPSFITTVEPYQFTRRLKVTRQSVERRDAKYQKALNEAAKLQVAAENTRTRHRFERLNDAFAVVTTQKELFDYGDAKALVASDHPTKLATGLTTQSNIVTASDITPTSIESMVLKLQNQCDDIGEPMPMGGGMKYFVVPPAKVKKAKENIESEWQVDVNNNNVNVWRGVGWVLVTSPFLSGNTGFSGSNTAWFVIDANFSPLRDVTFKPVTNESWFDENTKVFAHDISFEHKVGAFDWRGLAGNQGA